MKKRQPIRGLTQYFIFSSSGHFTVLAFLILSFGVFTLVFGATPVFSLITMILFGSFSFVSSVSDDKSNWNRFQLVMPVKRKDVVTSKYFIYLLFMGIALVIIGFFTATARILDVLDIVEYGSFAIGGIGPMAEAIQTVTDRPITLNLLYISIGSALLMCSVYYPLALTLFRGKEETLSFIVVIGQIAIGFLIVWLDHQLELPLDSMLLVNIVAPVILFALSYVFSCRVFEKIDV